MYLMMRKSGIILHKTRTKRLVYFLRKVFLSTQKNVKSFDSIPGPKSLPVIGTLHQYLPIIGSYRFDKLHINGFKKLKEFGPIVREDIVPGHTIVWLFDPEDIRILFNSKGEDYPRRQSHLALEKYRLDKPNVYNTGGLLPTNGVEWKRLRQVFQKGLSCPASCLTFLKGSDNIIAEWIDTRIKEALKLPSADYLPELSRLFLECKLETCLLTSTICNFLEFLVIGYVALDIRLDSFTEDEQQSFSRSSKLINAALVTNSCILKLEYGPQLWRKFDTPMYRRLKKAQDFMESVAIDLLSYKLSTYPDMSKQNAPPTLLEKYLANPNVDFKDIIGIICDFLLAGIDTTAYTSSFVLYYLGNYPEVQQTLYEESCRLLPDPNEPMTAEKFKEAHYARVVLKETLRLRPISVGIGRILTQEKIFSGYAVSPGTTVVTQNQISCRLERYFKSPNRFIPERWMKDRPEYETPHPFLVLPFGHGERSCIARRLAEQNIIIMMLKLVRKYEITWEGDELDTLSLLINKPDGPILLGLRKR